LKGFPFDGASKLGAYLVSSKEEGRITGHI
jgi:hypothetical protein